MILFIWSNILSFYLYMLLSRCYIDQIELKYLEFFLKKWTSRIQKYHIYIVFILYKYWKIVRLWFWHRFSLLILNEILFSMCTNIFNYFCYFFILNSLRWSVNSEKSEIVHFSSWSRYSLDWQPQIIIDNHFFFFLVYLFWLLLFIFLNLCL